MRAELGVRGRAVNSVIAFWHTWRRSHPTGLADGGRRLPPSALGSQIGGVNRLAGGCHGGCPPFASTATYASRSFDQATGSQEAGPEVCILGGGFGGLYTAITLEKLNWPEGKKPKVTLVDCSDRFVFKPLLYEVLQGIVQPWEAAPQFSELLAPYDTTFVQGQVLSIAPDLVTKDGGSAGGGNVVLEGGRSLRYDWLVLALGAEPDTRNVPGVKELALPFSTLDDALKVVERLRAVEASGTVPQVVVVGGGYAGVELAAAVGDRLRSPNAVVLVTNMETILDNSGDNQRAVAEKVLTDLGVEIRTGVLVSEVALASGTKDSEGAPKSIEVGLIPDPIHGGEGTAGVLKGHIILWTAGSRPVTGSQADALFPFPRGRAGALRTDSTLRVVNHARVFALGDISVANSKDNQAPFPATAQVAFQQSDYAAWNLWAAMNGRPLLPFRYQHLGNMMSLGGSSASVALPVTLPPNISRLVKDSVLGNWVDIAGVKLGEEQEKGTPVDLEGPLASFVRRAAYWYRQPTSEHRIRVGASWCQQVANEFGQWVQTRQASKS